MAHGPAAAKPIDHLSLHFRDEPRTKIPKSLSAVEQVGNALWLAGDETASVEQLTTKDYAGYGAHQSFPLASFFNLPGGPDQEADLEGLAFDPDLNRLWIVGSHSLRRGRPKPGDSDKDAFAALKHVDRQANRYLLGSIDLEDEVESSAKPKDSSGRALPFSRDGSALVALFVGTSRLGPFLDIPSKDNGLDIEGVAARGEKVYLGLRGPVLRGCASILQLALAPDGRHHWESMPFGKNGKRYRHHMVDLGGLGVRDLCIHGDDLLILAGPTMALDGPIRVLRWPGALKAQRSTFVERQQLQPLLELPTGQGNDHPEGIAIFKAPNRGPCLLVVDDSPAKPHLQQGHDFEADLFAI